MRILLVLALLGLGASAYFAPRYRESRGATVDPARFVIADPMERARTGVREGAIGLAMSGYREAADADPSNVEAARGRFRMAILLSVVALGNEGVPELVEAEIDTYLDRRAEIDPDGVVLQEALEEWVEQRLASEDWFMRAAAAVYLAGRGDERGLSRIHRWANEGPFHGKFFRYARRQHLGWLCVRPMIEHYLLQGDLNGRVQAGVTLIEYRNLFGIGGDLYQRFLPTIRDALREAKAALATPSNDTETVDAGHAAILGLAMLGGPEEIRILREMRQGVYPHHTDTLLVARLMAGLEPFSDYPFTGSRWELLDAYTRELFFRAACHRLVRLAIEIENESDPRARQRLIDARQEALEIAEAGLVSSDAHVRIYAYQTLVRHDPSMRLDLPARVFRARREDSLFAAFDLPDTDPTPVLLHAVTVPRFQYAALAVVSLLDLDGPPPVVTLPR